jgi:hypothetical protein
MHGIAIRGNSVGIGIKRVNESCCGIRFKDIVSIENDDRLPACLGDTQVDRSGLPGAGSADDSAVVLLGNRAGRIDRSAVDDDVLPLDVRLRGDAPKGLFEEGRCVERRRDDR